MSLLPVRRSSSPNVHSSSQSRILLFVRTSNCVILTISLQNHSSPSTTVFSSQYTHYTKYPLNHLNGTLHSPPADNKMSPEGCTLALGVHLQICPLNKARKIFPRPGGAPAPTAPPGYAYGWVRCQRQQNGVYFPDRWFCREMNSITQLSVLRKRRIRSATNWALPEVEIWRRI